MSEEEFDLSEFLGDSLILDHVTRAPARFINPKGDDPYKKFVLGDPFEILGEREFQKREEVSEHIKGTTIQEFYRGANVFITGATGFLGKILIEKLIRSVPHIGHIYLLIRAKRGKSPKERFDQLLEDAVFRRMKAEVPNYYDRLTAINGDIAVPDLGLSPEDRRLLTDSVNVVFHSAADVRFVEPLKTAVKSNVLGSRRVLELGKEMKNLWSYVHVSTAYSQCVRTFVEEKVPRMNIYYQKMLDYIDSKSDQEINEETPRLMQGWPNTYTFSKALCEEMVVEERKSLPLCIFRPSIVLPTYKEPVRGWTDNLYGPTGLFMGTGHGAIHCMRMDGELIADMVPVDYVINCMIAVAWEIAGEKSREKDAPKVYNFTCSTGPPAFPWKHAVEFSLEQKEVWPFSRAFWYTSYFYTKNWYLNEFCWYLLHRIPGACLDKILELTGGKPILTKVYKKVETLKEQTDYFTMHQWTFENENVKTLWNKLGGEDKKIFIFDTTNVDMREHFLVSKLGLRYYYLKEKMESIPAAVRKNTWLYWVHNSVKLTTSVLALKLLVMTANALPI